MLPVLLLLAAAPVTQPWSARIDGSLLLDPATKVTVFEARDLPVDTEPCVATKAVSLISDACTDKASTLRLIAAAKKAGPAKVLAKTTADAEGRFTVQVPPGRLFVRVEAGQYLQDFVVEPVPGVETRLKGSEPFTRRDLTRELADLLDARADAPDLREVWVVGQDNPQVLKLGKRDVDALSTGKYPGTVLWGCSKVVSVTGRVLGGTCEPQERKGRGLGLGSSLFTLDGRVTATGAPRAKVKVQVLGDEPLTALTDADGRFSLEVSSDALTVMVLVEDGELAATALVPVVRRFEEESPAQHVDLRLGRGELFRLQVKTSKGEPAAGALVRLWQRGGQLLDARTDAKGEVLAPRALQRSLVQVRFAGHRSFSRTLDLTRQPLVALEQARTLDVSFRRADGLLLHQPDARCESCIDVEQAPSRTGRVRLVLQGDAARVAPGPGSPEVTVSADGVFTLPPPAKELAVPFVVNAPGEPSTHWSTASGKPEPGLQYVRACFREDCVLQSVDVRPDGGVTLTPPPLTTLEVRTRGFTSGAHMPDRVEIRGPGLARERRGYFDMDGVARVKDLPPGPWLVQIQDGMDEGPGRWCRSGVPCELDLSATKAPRLQLRGDVPEEVSTSGQMSLLLDDQRQPVVDGGLEVRAGTTVVVEGTSALFIDGGAQSLTLAPPTTVEVRVLDPKGEPVRDAVVSWGRPTTNWLADHTGVTDADGKVSFERLRPGNLPLRVAKAGFALATTSGVAAKNEVRLQPGFDLTCRVPGLKASTYARCRASFAGGVTEEVESREGEMQLTDLPGALVTVELVLIEADPESAWTLTKQVDPSREREVRFEAPRGGVRLVLPFERGEVTVPKWGTAWCRQLGNGPFCETPPIPPGEVTVSSEERGLPPVQWKFQVPATGGRVLVPMPKVLP
ncbi:MAG: carboxypeptidase-like regulatory domain-containing protein [Archangium sp.]|nr:carboxypeptidase-like regulatory domain-containing protein [Archangium sp.]